MVRKRRINIFNSKTVCFTNFKNYFILRNSGLSCGNFLVRSPEVTYTMLDTLLVMGSIAVLVVSSEKCVHSLDKGVRWTVDCSAMNLSVTPDPVILHPVATLNISRNNFVQLVDSQFLNWTDILHLDLSSNSITTISADSFKGLSNLIELNLMNNEIEFLSPNITSSLIKLRILNMSSNKLKEIYPGSFEPVPLLLKLFLKNNLELGKTATSYDDLEVAFSQGLIALDFSNASLSEIQENFFINATRLISLNIALNPIKNIPHLAHSLRSLNISYTLIETVPQELFSNSDLLEKLYLQGLPFLKDIKARSLSGLSQLEEIIIKDCPKLSFISEDSFGESSPKLRKVVISDCALTTLPKTLMPLLNRVTHLDLQGNPWICDGRTAWITSVDIPVNLTGNLRCDQPSAARGLRLHDYFKPRSLHSHFTLIQGGIVVLMVAVFVASIVGMVRHVGKQKVKMYRQLQDIALQERTPTSLPPL